MAGGVKVTGLNHGFSGRPVLKNISFEVAEGEILSIMGSSGGGKTTLLRCISGLIRADSGEILVAGIDVNKEPEEARKRMGMVFQSAALFDYMNVRDNILFGLQRTRNLSASEELKVARAALARVGLEGQESKVPGELSGGMRKRAGIARAVALEPSVLLYDEPTTGLDPIMTYTIDELIEGLRRELGVTSILVSHDVVSVFRVADRVAFLHEGRLTFLGTPEEFEKSEDPAIREILNKSRAKTLEIGK